MARRVSESTDALLEAFREDLQRQLRHAEVVERLVLDEDDRGRTTLTAVVRVAAEAVELTGTGGNLVSAYASLTRAEPELLLASAYRQVLDRAIGP